MWAGVKYLLRENKDTLVPRAGFCWVTTTQIKRHAGLRWERGHLGLKENHPSVPRCDMCNVYYRVKINSLKSGHPDNLNFAVCAILRLITWTKIFQISYREITNPEYIYKWWTLHTLSSNNVKKWYKVGDLKTRRDVWEGGCFQGFNLSFLM